MSSTSRTAKSVLSVFAASLVASTLLTGSLALSTAPSAFAQGTIAEIDPTKGFAPLVEHVMPSVVSVEVKFQPASAETGRNRADVPPQLREFFEQFPQFRDRFDDGQRGNRGGSGVGSGFVISADGYVVTNNHVVNNASAVKVKFQGGDSFDAKVIGTDAKTDLALLKIDASKTFDFVPLTDADSKVGDWVMAVGNPFGLGGTVTAGIVSARGRDIGSGPYDDYLQIDASINKGNSGGPAFNLKGEVVGVNTAIFSPSGGSVGIGFAIPASIVKGVVDDLKTNGQVTRGYLGVQIQPVTQDIADSLGLDKAEGAIISNLTEKSPALKAGLKAGDTIVTANGEKIEDAKDLCGWLETRKLSVV
jgi:serine protease Do